jgi:uncharacterized damage-inducible protein DinB
LFTPSATAESFEVDVEQLSLAEARDVMRRDGVAWAEFLALAPDPDAMVREIDSTDGYERSAPVGFRLAAALQHGAEHRAQICAALTSIGVEPPAIDVFNYGVDIGRVIEVMPTG